MTGNYRLRPARGAATLWIRDEQDVCLAPGTDRYRIRRRSERSMACRATIDVESARIPRSRRSCSSCCARTASRRSRGDELGIEVRRMTTARALRLRRAHDRADRRALRAAKHDGVIDIRPPAQADPVQPSTATARRARPDPGRRRRTASRARSGRRGGAARAAASRRAARRSSRADGRARSRRRSRSPCRGRARARGSRRGSATRTPRSARRGRARPPRRRRGRAACARRAPGRCPSPAGRRRRPRRRRTRRAARRRARAPAPRTRSRARRRRR